MKKLLSLTLAVMFVVAIAGSSFADVVTNRGQDARIKAKSYTYSTTAQDLTGTIVAGTNRVFGSTVTGTSASTAALFDTTSTSSATGGTGEILSASCAAGTAVTVMFPLPYEITSGLYLNSIGSTSVVTIYYD